MFNTPGANANGVKELVIAGLCLLAARDIVGGIELGAERMKKMPILPKTREKAKKAFAGYEMQGKKLGVIGLGAIGVAGSQRSDSILAWMCMDMIHIMSVDAAWKLSRGYPPYQ